MSRAKTSSRQFESRVGVVAVDDYTLEYHLSGPTPYFLSFLTLEMFLPLEQDFLDSVGEDFGTAQGKPAVLRQLLPVHLGSR